MTSAAVAAAGAADTRFTLDFRAADGAWQRGPLMSCLGVRFEDVPPVRPFRFEKGLRNFAGWCVSGHAKIPVDGHDGSRLTDS